MTGKSKIDIEQLIREYASLISQADGLEDHGYTDEHTRQASARRREAEQIMRKIHTALRGM